MCEIQLANHFREQFSKLSIYTKILTYKSESLHEPKTQFYDFQNSIFENSSKVGFSSSIFLFHLAMQQLFHVRRKNKFPRKVSFTTKKLSIKSALLRIPVAAARKAISQVTLFAQWPLNASESLRSLLGDSSFSTCSRATLSTRCYDSSDGSDTTPSRGAKYNVTEDKHDPFLRKHREQNLNFHPGRIRPWNALINDARMMDEKLRNEKGKLSMYHFVWQRRGKNHIYKRSKVKNFPIAKNEEFKYPRGKWIRAFFENYGTGLLGLNFPFRFSNSFVTAFLTQPDPTFFPFRKFFPREGTFNYSRSGIFSRLE